jgi:MFS family permease
MFGALLGTGMPFFYTIADSYPHLIAAAVCQGLSSSALDMGITAAYSSVPLPDRAKMAASWTSLTGFRGAIVPFLSGIMVQSNLFTVTQALLVCTTVSVTGILYYLWIVVRPPAEAPLAISGAA